MTAPSAPPSVSVQIRPAAYGGYVLRTDDPERVNLTVLAHSLEYALDIARLWLAQHDSAAPKPGQMRVGGALSGSEPVR